MIEVRFFLAVPLVDMNPSIFGIMSGSASDVRNP